MVDQANELRHLVRRRADASARPDSTGPSIITVTGGKGGVGTTTVAINLAVAMARQSDRVLLVDADPDRTDVATLCGLSAPGDLADLVIGRRALDDVMVPGPDGIFVVSGAQRTEISEPAIDRFHERWVESVRETVEPFDTIVVDTGNGSSHAVKKLWEVSDLVLLVTTDELPSILDAYASIKSLADPMAWPSIHSLVNQVSEPAVAYDVHGRLARAVWRFLGFHLDSAGHLTIAQRPSTGESVDRPFAPAQRNSPLAREFGQLARTLRTALTESTRKQAAWRRIDRAGKATQSQTVDPSTQADENLVSQAVEG